MKLSFHTSQQVSPGSTSLQLAIAYTDGVLNEDQVSSAIQLGIDAIQRSRRYPAQSFPVSHTQ